MKVAVTGASGYIGSHVVRVLLEAGHEVRFDGSRVERDLGIRYASWDQTILDTVASVRELLGR